MMALEGLAGQEEALFHRKIEFHLARKQFNGFGKISDNGFKLVTLNPKASDTNKESGSAKKSECLELLETRLDPELSFRITYRRIGAGLRNLGNTCFLNSVLQCLTYTEPLAAYLQSGKHQNSCRTAGFCALCAIQKHVSCALQSTGRILEPKDLVSNLRCISRNFRNARQEDAHEYMVNLLESMHKCCLPSGISSESPSAYEKSLVHKIFGGRLRSQVKCTQCSYCSNKFDPFLDLSLEINKADSLYKALAHFTAKEQLDGGAKQYHCQQCKQKVRALKQLSVYKPPNVLAIHLKRFGSYSPGQKNDKNVSFGPNLDLKPFVTGPYDGDLKYTLYGVLVHAGWSTHSGHYYCFVRTSSGMWYTLDDNHVNQVSEKKVLEQKAYMLFYVRDGGNFVAKKPVDINHKESMVANATSHTKSNPELRVKTQNGTVERKIEVSNASVSEKGVLPITTAPKEITLKKIPLENGNGSVFVDSSDLTRDPQLEPSLAAPPVNDSENSPSLTRNSDGKQAGSSLTTEASGTAFISGHGAKIVDCNNRGSKAQDMNNDKANKNENKSADNPPLSSGLCTTSGEVDDNGSNAELPTNGKAVLAGAIKVVSNNIDSSKTSKKRSIESLSPDKPNTTEQLSAKNKRPKLKMKKNLFMHQVSSMPLSSNIIFGTALRLQMKQKRRKSHSLQNKSNIMRLKNEKADDVSVDRCTQSQKAKENCSSYDGDKSECNASGNGVISADAMNNELKQRLKTDSTVVLSKKPENKEPVSNGPDSSGNLLRESKQNNMMSLLMRGLEETTVERWDGIDVSLSEKAALRQVESDRIIGHVGDEWDEEYDRGKRKKIKSSTIRFEGPNLFQAIASKNNTQRKQPKLH